MTGRSRLPRRNKRQRTKATSAPPSESDAVGAALAEFCEAIELSEISFEAWENVHRDLDLFVPLWITPKDAEQGGEMTVTFSRTLSKDNTSAPSRERSSHVVRLPPGIEDGYRLVVPGQGDARGDQAGDLIVIVHIKRES